MDYSIYSSASFWGYLYSSYIITLGTLMYSTFGWIISYGFLMVILIAFLKFHLKSKKPIVNIFKDIYKKVGDIIKE